MPATAEATELDLLTVLTAGATRIVTAPIAGTDVIKLTAYFPKAAARPPIHAVAEQFAVGMRTLAAKLFEP